MMLASYVGLIAKDWNKEKGVSYANPAFLAGAENLEASEVTNKDGAAKAQPVDLSDIDPLAPRYKEWEERAAKIAVTEIKRAETLPFGGDKWGRDVLQKAVKGSEVSIFVGLTAALFATLIGTMLGAAGRLLGRQGQRLPRVVLQHLHLDSLHPADPRLRGGVQARPRHRSSCILALTGWTGIYRLVRAEYIKHCGREYVKAAQAIGASHFSRMFVHILPNASHVILVQLSQHVVSSSRPR